MTQTRARSGGFTLTECMIAAAVLMAAVAGLVMPFSLAAKAQRLDAMQTSAATLAGQMMERMQTMTDEEVLALDGTTEVGSAITGVDGAALGHASLDGFTRTISAQEVTINEAGANGAATFVRATVTVSRDQMPAVTLVRLFGEVGFYGGHGGTDADTETQSNGDDDGDNGHGNDADGHDDSNPGNGGGDNSSNAGGNGNGNGFGGNNSDQTGNSNDNGVGGSNHSDSNGNSNSNGNGGSSSNGNSRLSDLLNRLFGR